MKGKLSGPDPDAATELVKIDGVVDAIVRHLKKSLFVQTYKLSFSLSC
ncbi:hypothetical protein HanXRQr2_Chr11g0496641 [Helianthus annuus]|uniref:Uncharacterized protein n=1 Tax=Helianthus annuus TaxID=4232 RepID=A0A9K3HQG5_HELAN|nr:hypothetical protein HanXRQr2_Chr11g0496641 [Helianthus annuus]KAJ0875632.1 hypothetical protein HanPSC8_Chr11g0478681 [Helianthus annuus]